MNDLVMVLATLALGLGVLLTLRSPWPYHGAKSNLLPTIIPMLKRIEDYRERVLVEPFSGSLKVTLALARLCQAIRINDADPSWAHCVNSVIWYGPEVAGRLGLDPPTAKVFRQFQEQLEQVTGDPLTASPEELIEVGYRRYFVQKLAFAGWPKCGFSASNARRWKPLAYAQQVRDLHAWFTRRRVVGGGCTCLDFAEVVKGMKGQPWLGYIDPPYWSFEGDYTGGFSKEDHVRLAELLRECSMPWLLSYNDVPEIRRLYGSWATCGLVPVRYYAGKKRVWELLVTNRPQMFAR